MRPGGRPEAVPLHATERNPQRETTGPRVARVASAMGTSFMPWQHDAVAITREVDPETGHPWYREVLIVVERQAGKTTLVRADLTETCLFKPHANVRYTAQTRTMALQRLENDMWRPISESPLRAFLDPRVGRRTGKVGLSGKGGQEHIAFANGAGWWIDSVKDTSGHGPTLDKGGIDEAFAQRDARIEQAMNPAMATVPDAQLLIASAAGTTDSTYLRAKLDAAIARLEVENAKPVHARRSRTALIHYAVGPDEDPDDPETWWRRHPALGHTITQATIEASRESFEADPDEFYRAYCGLWTKAKLPDPVVPRQSWQDARLHEDDVDWTGDPVWGIDVSPDHEWASVGMAAAHPGRRAWLEVIDHENGTHWVVRRLVQLREQFGGNYVAIDGAGAAGSLEQDLLDEDFEVVRLSIRQKADACGGFYDDAVTADIAHGDDPVLNTALYSAVKHRVGDGGWVFSRGKSLHDISALYAVVVARWLHARLNGDAYDPDNSTM